jgi:hypothetical protein
VAEGGPAESLQRLGKAAQVLGWLRGRSSGRRGPP